MSATDRRQVLRRALEACILGQVESLPDLFTADVSAWSPNLLVTSRDELAEAIAGREDAISDVTVQVDALDIFGNKGFAEYRLSGTFSGPLAFSEDTVIEPNGHELLLGAAIVAEFKGDKISAFRNYFDDASLIEQMLAA
jgi:ketosteroid isomerase-like protein